METLNLARQAAAAVILVGITLWLQCAGMAVLIHRARVDLARATPGVNPWRAAVLMVRLTTLAIVLHVLEILVWAGFYRWHGLSSWESGFYFSASSYSTVGYTDVSLPGFWRSLAPLESIVGVLMCGMSVSVLLAIGAKLVEAETEATP